MKLSLSSAKPIAASIKNPLTKPALSVKFEAPFNKQHARILGCQQLYDDDGHWAHFTSVGLDIEIPESSVVIVPTVKGKAREFNARVTVEEILQTDGDVTVVVRLIFPSDKIVEATGALFLEGHEEGFHSLTIEGKQAELFEQGAEPVTAKGAGE